jgi:nucleoid DNA-binding protein
MNPKKHKEFKKGLAEEVGVHPQVVDDFISFYYSKLRKSLSTLAFPRINVEGIGTFELRKAKLALGIKKNKSILGNIAKRTYNGYAKSESIQENITQMESAMIQMESDILKRKDFKTKKNE